MFTSRIGWRLATVVLLCALPLVACKKHDDPKHQKVQIDHKTVQLEHLRDGRYAYRGDDGFWWYYIIMTSINNNSTATAAATSRVSSSLPAGGTWSRSTAAPAKEDVEETEEATVEEGAGNQPMTDEEVSAAETANAEAATEATAPETAPAPEAAPVDTAPADSGTSVDAGTGGE